MLARFSAHHEPFYRALRARRIAVSQAAARQAL